MSKRLWSAFTEDMEHCYLTGMFPVEIHHIFPASNRKKCEKYGYVVPLYPTKHPNGVRAGKDAKEIDTYLKQMAQKHFEENHGSRADFIREFGKSYL